MKTALKCLGCLVTILCLWSCNSSNPAMTWDEFKNSGMIQKEGLDTTETGLCYKVINEGQGVPCNYLQKLQLNIKFEDLAGKTLQTNNDSTTLASMQEAGGVDVSKAIYQMKAGEVKEVYMPSESAVKAGLLKEVQYPVVKAIITLEKIINPSWEVTIKGKTSKIEYGMSEYDVHELLGLPFDIRKDDSIGLSTWVYKDSDNKTTYSLMFENGVLTSVTIIK